MITANEFGEDLRSGTAAWREREKELAVLIVELLALATDRNSEWAATHEKELVRRARRVIDGVPAAVAQGEADYQAFCAANPDRQAEGTPDSLALIARMIERYAADTLPADEHGRIHFARAMLESAAREILAFLKLERADG